MNPHLALLLSTVYDRSGLHPDHVADLRASGITDETITRQKIRSVPPAMIQPLLGFDIPAIRSALLIPFPDPRGGWMDLPRIKVFPPLKDAKGHTTKYLQPRVPPRLFFPLATLELVLTGRTALWLVEGEKKSLAIAQLGLPAVGFCGIEGWHAAGSFSLIPDFGVIPLRGRVVRLLPDGDVQWNRNVERGARRFSEALAKRGATVRLVRLVAGSGA